MHAHSRQAAAATATTRAPARRTRPLLVPGRDRALEERAPARPRRDHPGDRCRASEVRVEVAGRPRRHPAQPAGDQGRRARVSSQAVPGRPAAAAPAGQRHREDQHDGDQAERGQVMGDDGRGGRQQRDGRPLARRDRGSPGAARRASRSSAGWPATRSRTACRRTGKSCSGRTRAATAAVRPSRQICSASTATPSTSRTCAAISTASAACQIEAPVSAEIAATVECRPGKSPITRTIGLGSKAGRRAGSRGSAASARTRRGKRAGGVAQQLGQVGEAAVADQDGGAQLGPTPRRQAQ